jgi:hypothetical protein
MGENIIRRALEVLTRIHDTTDNVTVTDLNSHRKLQNMEYAALLLVKEACGTDREVADLVQELEEKIAIRGLDAWPDRIFKK